MKLRHTALHGAILVALTAGRVFAADAATDINSDPSAKHADPKTLDTVQVTATKRETPLQKTPIAISVIDASTLDKEHVDNVTDLTKLVPGFAATTEGDHGLATLTLRGVGNDSAKTEYADPEVAIFVDGVYQPRAEAAVNLLLDMQSAEVLRGPQGTLWGRNSTVGAVNFQTAKPELGSQFGYAQFEAGDYGTLGARAAVNVPMSDTFAFRVAVAHEQHDGYVDFQSPVGQLPSVAQQQASYLASGGTLATFQPINPNDYITSGKKYNSQDQSAARVSTLWKPADDFSWNLSFDYFRDTGTPNANLMQVPRAGQDFWSTLATVAPMLDRSAYQLRSHMDWQLGSGMQLSYIAGFSKEIGSEDFDQDGGVILPTSFATGGSDQDDRTNFEHYRSYSHELDLKSSGDNTVDWILGLYYAAEDNSIRFDIPILNGTPQGTIGWQGSFIQPKELVESYAAFGQATWHLSDALRLTAGARWTHDEKKNDGGIGWSWGYDPNVPQYAIAPTDIPSLTNGWTIGTANTSKYSAGKATWLVRADYDLSDTALLYGSVSTGYKSGGLQDGGASYAGETLTNYEVGLKLSFLDHHLTWNSALYHEDFKNFQLSAPITYLSGAHGLGFSNVQGSTLVTGLESEIAAQLGDFDQLNLVLSAMPQKKLGTLHYAGSNDYAGLPPCPSTAPLGVNNCIDITGNDLAHAPDFAATLIYEHKFMLSNGAYIVPRFSGHYETASWLSPFNLGAGDRQQAYFRGDLSARYTNADDRWWAGLYANNFTDVKVRTNAGRAQAANGSFIYTSQYLPPRTFGVNFGVNF